jgi:hypothetical protein
MINNPEPVDSKFKALHVVDIREGANMVLVEHN